MKKRNKKRLQKKIGAEIARIISTEIKPLNFRIKSGQAIAGNWEKTCQKSAETQSAYLDCRHSSPKNLVKHSHADALLERWKIQKAANTAFAKSLALLPIDNLGAQADSPSQNSALPDLQSVLANLQSLHFQLYQHYVHSSCDLSTFTNLIEAGEAYIRGLQDLINSKSKGA